MKSILRRVVVDWTPPALIQILRNRRGGKIHFEGEFTTWDEALTHSGGYNADSILAKVLDATLKVKHGEVAFERDSVVFDEIEYSWPVTAGLMWAAARHGGRLDVLDFGGSLGSSYFQNKRFLTHLSDVRWNVVEQTHYAEAGQQHITDRHLRFYSSIDLCLLDNQPNTVLLSSVLQYLPEPFRLLKNLLSKGIDTVILDRTSYLNNCDRQRICVQHVPASIYDASYPIRFFVESEILKIFSEAGYELVEDFVALDKLETTVTWKGHLFVRGTTL